MCCGNEKIDSVAAVRWQSVVRVCGERLGKVRELDNAAQALMCGGRKQDMRDGECLADCARRTGPLFCSLKITLEL